MPGEIEYNIVKQRLEKGIPLSVPVIEELKAIGERQGIETKFLEQGSKHKL